MQVEDQKKSYEGAIIFGLVYNFFGKSKLHELVLLMLFAISVVVDGKLYVMGGSDSQLSVLTAECLDLTQPEDQWAWHPVASLPTWHNGSFTPGTLHNLLYMRIISIQRYFGSIKDFLV